MLLMLLVLLLLDYLLWMWLLGCIFSVKVASVPMHSVSSETRIEDPIGLFVMDVAIISDAFWLQR